MLKNRGEILEKVVRQSNMSVVAIARQMGVERSTVYRHFTLPDLDAGIILRYSKVLRHDFSEEFPELFSDLKSIINEPDPSYGIAKSYGELMNERDYWKDKYITLLERYNELIVKTYSAPKE